MKYKIGTRGSKLAMRQSQMVADILKKARPGHDFTLEIIKTKGDLDQHTPLEKFNDKGLFVSEIEDKLRTGEIQLAVHSMKDMPTIQPKGICFAKALKGEDARDVVICKHGEHLDTLKLHAQVATGSIRRSALLQELRPDLHICPIRGNVDTRIQKLHDTSLDALVLAAAGIHRLNRAHEISEYLDPTIFIPACTQGILAIEVCANQQDILSIFEDLHDADTQLRVESERAFLSEVEGGCHIPVGAYLKVDQEDITLYGMLGKEDGSCLVKGSIRGKRHEAYQMGIQLAQILLKKRAEKEHA